MYRQSVCILLSVLCGGWLLQPAQAQPTENKKQSPFSGSPLSWDINPILDIYVTNISRHYNLSDEQTQYTRALLTTRVKQFLVNYEKDVRELFAEYMTYQFGQKLPPPEIAMDFANRAQPLIEAMRQEIMSGNAEWRNNLDEQQRRTHDRDMEGLNQYFEQINSQLENWKEGKVSPLDPQPKLISDPRRNLRHEDIWDSYVNRFIRQYSLNPGQRETAYSILRDMKQAAAAHREAQKEKFANIEGRYKELRAKMLTDNNPAALEEYQKKARELMQERRQLEAPIGNMFKQLKARLELIPTAEQKRVVEERERALRKYTHKGATQPAAATQPGLTTRPAATAPAASKPS